MHFLKLLEAFTHCGQVQTVDENSSTLRNVKPKVSVIIRRDASVHDTLRLESGQADVPNRCCRM